jgi:hypothetical protein
VWVSVVLGGLMLLLSLGMFGLYEMQPPTWLLDKLGGAQATNFAGAFLSGLGVGIIAAPCVGPFVVAVLALIAQKGDMGFGVQTMFTLSLGLGFPYLFLATFSNLLQALPRSGDWMVWVKHVFGLIMAAIGVYYILIGVAPDFAPWVLPVALLAGGAWLGFLDHSAGERGRFKAFTQAAGLLALIAGVVMGSTMYQASHAHAQVPAIRRGGRSSERGRGPAGDDGLLGELVCALPRTGAGDVHRSPRRGRSEEVRPLQGGPHQVQQLRVQRDAQALPHQWRAHGRVPRRGRLRDHARARRGLPAAGAVHGTDEGGRHALTPCRVAAVLDAPPRHSSSPT